MFRQRNLLVRFPVKDGAHVLARGRVSLYEARGEFQVVIDHLEEAGEGVAAATFRGTEDASSVPRGCSTAAHKQPLPRPARGASASSPRRPAPRCATSCTSCAALPGRAGAGLPGRRAGRSRAARDRAGLAARRPRRDCDVLIVARGGGSLEDLWAFNDEAVARAIFACPIPVVSGVGHEVDFTIADFVADERAPTPSGAAERVRAGPRGVAARLGARERSLALAMRRKLTALARRRAGNANGRCTQLSPRARLRQHAQRLDELEQRLQRAVGVRLERARSAAGPGRGAARPQQPGAPARAVAATPGRRTAAGCPRPCSAGCRLRAIAWNGRCARCMR